MLKKFVNSVMVLLLLSACSKTKSINIENVSKELVDNLCINDIVTKLDKNEIESLLYLNNEDIEEGVFYISNVNTSDMVAILKGKDNKQLLSDVEDYVNLVKVQNTNYFPEEVIKLENAIIKEKDGYIFLIVSNNQKYISEYLSK